MLAPLQDRFAAIPVAALNHPRERSFAEVLAAMPEVGSDADFERLQTGTQKASALD